MESLEKIANDALGALGLRPIETFGDESPRARAAQMSITKTIRQLFSYPYTCNRREAALAATEPPETQARMDAGIGKINTFPLPPDFLNFYGKTARSIPSDLPVDYWERRGQHIVAQAPALRIFYIGWKYPEPLDHLIAPAAAALLAFNLAPSLASDRFDSSGRRDLYAAYRLLSAEARKQDRANEPDDYYGPSNDVTDNRNITQWEATRHGYYR